MHHCRILLNMKRELASICTIALLFILLVLWWLVSTVKFPNYDAYAQNAALSTPQKLLIYHTSHGTESYSGSLVLPQCSDLQATVISSSASVLHVQIALASKRQPACSHTTATSTPFEVSVASGSKKPVLDSVSINNEPVPFTVVEHQ